MLFFSVPKCSLSYGGYAPGNNILAEALTDMTFQDCNNLCQESPKCHGTLWGNLHNEDLKQTCQFKTKHSAKITPRNGLFTSVPRHCCKRARQIIKYTMVFNKF